jgi:ketopantoate reductase
MRIAVIGVGGAFGAALAKAGGDVTFVARRPIWRPCDRPTQRGAAFHSLCQKAGFESVNSNAHPPRLRDR